MSLVLNGNGAVTGVTSLNTDVSDTELGYLDGVTSALQTQINAGGLVKVVDQSFTTATAVSVNDCFTSAYENYRLIIKITAVSADSTFTLRMRASGTDDSAGNYDFGFDGITNAAGASAVGANATSFNVGESDAAAVRYRLSMDVLGPQVAERTTLHGFYSFVNTAATSAIFRYGGGQYATTAQFDGFSFISNVASSITGTIKIYGYRN